MTPPLIQFPPTFANHSIFFQRQLLKKMDGLLTEVKTVTHGRDTSLLIVEEGPVNGLERHRATSEADTDADPTSADFILTVLKSKPDRAGLYGVLKVLDPSNEYIIPKAFDIRVPSPTTAQILNALGTVTIPDHWAALNTKSKGSTPEANKLRAVLLRCFSSVSGISCLVAQLRSLITAARSSSQQAKASGSQIQIRDILTILSALLKPKDLTLRIYIDIEALYSNSTQKQVAWREFLSLIAASKVLSATAEALTLVGNFDGLSTISWIGDGPKYTSWLGTNICHMVSKLDFDNQGAWKAVTSLTGRALSLGYTGTLHYLYPISYADDYAQIIWPANYTLACSSTRLSEYDIILSSINFGQWSSLRCWKPYSVKLTRNIS